MLPPLSQREATNGYGTGAADYRPPAGGPPPPGAAGDSYSSSYTSYYDRYYNKAGGAGAPPGTAPGRPGAQEPQSLMGGQFGGGGADSQYGRPPMPKKPDTQTALQTGPIFF